MEIITTPLDGLILIQPKIFKDERGCFLETFQAERYQKLGIPTFVQDNFSQSKKDVLRGLHYQRPHAQGKLVSVLQGRVFDVVVDIRKSSKTFGNVFTVVLDDLSYQQMYIPPGFAHGFCVLSDSATFMYKCTDYYSPPSEHGIIWNDPTLQIDWPVTNPILAPKDKLYSPLSEICHESLFA